MIHYLNKDKSLKRLKKLKVSLKAPKIKLNIYSARADLDFGRTHILCP